MSNIVTSEVNILNKKCSMEVNLNCKITIDYNYKTELHQTAAVPKTRSAECGVRSPPKRF